MTDRLRRALGILVVGGLVGTFFVLLAAQHLPPNRRAEVDAVYAMGGYDLTTKAGDCAFTLAVARRLHATDPKFGLLKKRASQNQCADTQTAVDAVLYLATPPGLSTAVDIIASSESPRARPAWTLDLPRYTPDDWLDPDEVPGAPIPDPGTPVPDPGTPPVDLGPLLQRLSALEARSQQLDTAMAAAVAELRAAEAKLDAHHVQIEELIQRPNPWPAYRGRIFGFPITVWPVEVP
jgi:hypothetical protein